MPGYGYHDHSNNQAVNLAVHNAASDAERGLPAVGKLVYRTDSLSVQLCTATTPDPTLPGGGTWISLGP